MVIEDEDLVLGVACRMLEAVGRETTGASTAAEAFEALGASTYAAILLDLTLPDMSGRELFDRIRECSPDTYLVVTSGYDRADVTRDIDLGETPFLAKPYALEDIQRIFGCAS